MLLVVGATSSSSNVHDTSLEELQKLVHDLERTQSGDEQTIKEETLLVRESPYLAVSLVESLL